MAIVNKFVKLRTLIVLNARADYLALEREIDQAKRVLLPYVRDFFIMSVRIQQRALLRRVRGQLNWLASLRRPVSARRSSPSKSYYRSNVKLNIRTRVSSLMRYHLRKHGSSKTSSLESILGYSIDDLRARLASTMPPGFNWQDYLSGLLHIDHIIPLSVHNYSSVKSFDFARAWALSNLRLLPAAENIAKGATLSAPFQPSLDI